MINVTKSLHFISTNSKETVISNHIVLSLKKVEIKITQV